jgi:organic hydroperoxide reductase OsmC/OhrA
MEKEHHYLVSTVWTGNLGEGTQSYRGFSRDHEIRVEGKADIDGSSDPSFRGSANRYNPEELLVSSLSACHMLWYLHLCSVNQIVVTDYRDQAKGTMLEGDDGGGHFKEVVLNPTITLKAGGGVEGGGAGGGAAAKDGAAAAAMMEKAKALHEEANKLCFIARSVNFPVRHKPVFVYFS